MSSLAKKQTSCISLVWRGSDIRRKSFTRGVMTGMGRWEWAFLCPGGTEQMGMGFPGGVHGWVGLCPGQPVLMPGLLVGSSSNGWCLELEGL